MCTAWIWRLMSKFWRIQEGICHWTSQQSCTKLSNVVSVSHFSPSSMLKKTLITLARVTMASERPGSLQHYRLNPTGDPRTCGEKAAAPKPRQRGSRSEAPWCLSSSRSGLPHRCFRVGSGRSGSTPMRSMRFLWPTPVSQLCHCILSPIQQRNQCCMYWTDRLRSYEAYAFHNRSQEEEVCVRSEGG